MEYSNLLVTREENIAIVTFNRPKVLNTLNHATMRELSAVMDELDNDKDAMKALSYSSQANLESGCALEAAQFGLACSAAMSCHPSRGAKSRDLSRGAKSRDLSRGAWNGGECD